MASNSFIPAPNGEFNNWQANFVKVVNNYSGDWQLSSMAMAEWTALTVGPNSKKAAWEKIWGVVSTRDFKRSEQVEMLAARKSYEYGKKESAKDTSLRIFISRYLRNNPLVSKKQKKEMGLTVPDPVRTPTSAEPSGGAGAEFQGSVAFGTHLVHHNLVRIPGLKSKARAKGVENIQVFIAFTEASVKTPPDMKYFAYDGTVKSGKYVRVFEPEQEAMRAWYYIRLKYKGHTHSYGPPSEYWNAVIM
jgi:hypothetical protein